MILLDERDKRPIYEQITDRFSDLIARGALKTDEPLPSVRALAVELSINPNTVQKAYIELERRGYIYSVKGKGSFIADGEMVRRDLRSEIRRELRDLLCRADELGMDGSELREELDRHYASKNEEEGARV